MEGKAVLFKKFSGVDVFDIEIEERDPDKFIEIVAGLEATFGGINLEDIKAPECFLIEERLRERMKIPVFHDDQHGTAIVTAAALVSGLKVVDKKLADCKLVASGAGAASIACLNLLVNMGLSKSNIRVVDRLGVVHTGRLESLDPHKAQYAVETAERSLDDAMVGADIFLGLSGPGLLSQDACKKMADKPLILALANPDPEITPEEARAVRPDAIIATGRSDYPNQVNNVLCFPFIFRGALDVGATSINEEMKIACVNALSGLAEAEPSDIVKRAYAGEPLTFGPEYLIPKPFDPRLITEIPVAVARAAMESGVATRDIDDFQEYHRQLSEFVYKSSGVMEPIFERAQNQTQRLAYAEGEEERVLQAAKQVVDEGVAYPVLVGREEVIRQRLQALGLNLVPDRDCEIVDPHGDPRRETLAQEYYGLMQRRGISMARAKRQVRVSGTLFSSLLLRTGAVDGVICGTVGPFREHLARVINVIGKAEDVRDLSTMVALILAHGTYFICDTHVTPEPSAEELAEMAVLASTEVERFGLAPKVALLSHSNFGTYDSRSAMKVREAVELLRRRAPGLELDGEMHGEAAIVEEIRNRVFPESTLEGKANLLVMPNVDAAHICYTLLKVIGEGVSVGPVLLGAAQPVNIVTQSITVRGLLNMSAYTAVQAQVAAE
jgi:malate dehydrogenase (oxaloacetate-decarboxylating)(NADP+)